MAITDRYGLPVSTSSPVATERYVVCHLRRGRLEDAVRLLRRRLDRRPSPRDLSWLAEAEAAIAEGARRG